VKFSKTCRRRLCDVVGLCAGDAHDLFIASRGRSFALITAGFCTRSTSAGSFDFSDDGVIPDGGRVSDGGEVPGTCVTFSLFFIVWFSSFSCSSVARLARGGFANLQWECMSFSFNTLSSVRSYHRFCILWAQGSPVVVIKMPVQATMAVDSHLRR